MRYSKIIHIIIVCLLIPTISLATKRALIIGIADYPINSGWIPLSSGNDIILLKKTFADIGNIHSVINNQATKRGIVKNLNTLIEETQAGDTILIHFSGHGQQMLTSDSSEEDRLDEAFIPYDALKTKTHVYTGQNHLTDNELSTYVNEIRKKAGVNGMVIVSIDACHSGNMDRNTNETTEKKYVVRGTDETFGVANAEVNDSLLAYSRDDTTRIEKNNIADVLYLSACGQHELNREITVDGLNYGSLSYCISRAYRKNGINDISTFIHDVMATMKTEMPFQTPKIRTSLALHLDTDSLETPQISSTSNEIADDSNLRILILIVLSVLVICALWKLMEKK